MRKSPIFAALLTPHRSLGRCGIHYVVAFYATLASIPGLYFFFSGAWPIVGFLGLDAVLLWWALLASAKSGKAVEEVTLWADALEVRHVSGRGREVHYAFNPFWVKLHIERDHDENICRLWLRSREKVLEIGVFLNLDDKASFAKVFGQALSGRRI